MIVQKFGGSSLADLDGFVAAASIISNAAANEKVVVVLSAMFEVTDLLEAAINTAIEGGDFKTVVKKISEKEQGIVQKMKHPDGAVLWQLNFWKYNFNVLSPVSKAFL